MCDQAAFDALLRFLPLFEVPYRVDVCGAHEIKGNVDFALCRDEACAPVTEPVTATIGVC